MNGWYVEVLLLNREIIKFNIENQQSLPIGRMLGRHELEEYHDEDSDWTLWDFYYLYNDIARESDVYSDLLDVERVYNKLVQNNTITKDEIESLKHILLEGSLRKATKSSGTNRATITKNFKSLCSKIAYFLGGHFTDEGYIEYLREKYDLDYKQIIKIYNYIKSEYSLREVILG